MNPATTEELGTLKMIIYGIHNAVSNKWYIGQAIKTFRGRYPGLIWWRSRMLKGAYEKYGSDAFQIFILEHNVDSVERLSELEKNYIVKYNSIIPNGYNIEKGGRNRRNAPDTQNLSPYPRRRKEINTEEITN